MSSIYKKSLMSLVCAGLFFTSAPALAQLGPDFDPRLNVAVTQDAYPEQSSVLMLDDIKFNVNPDRSFSFEEHDAVKVLNRQGVEENATLVRVVDSNEARIEVLQARTIKPDGRVLKAGPPQISPLLPTSKSYGAVKRFILRFPDVQVGDIVEFHVKTIHNRKPGGHFWATTYVQNPMPILESTFTVNVPKGIDFRTATPGHPKSKPEKKTVEKDGVKYQQLRWEIKKEKAYQLKTLAPRAVSLLKRIEVSSFKDWREVSEFLKKDWQANHQLSEGLLLRVAGWMPDTGGIQERAQAVARELNKARQAAGFLADFPDFHEAQPIFDEKLISTADQTLITSLALDAAGIPNVPIATLGLNSKSLEDELPIPEKIGKVILEIPRAGSESLWYDPESPAFILDSLPINTSDTAAFSWDSRFRGGDRLKDLAKSSAFDNREELVVEGRLESSGKAELTVQFDRYGATAINSRQAAQEILNEGRDARDRALANFFNNTARAYGVRSRLLTRYFELDPDSADPHSISYTLAVPGFAQVQDKTMLVPLPRFLDRGIRAAARDRNRKTPLVFEQPYQQDIRIHLVFPEGSEVSSFPSTITKRTDESEFVATSRAEGNELWYVGRLTVFDPWIEDEDLKSNIETLKAALESEDTILKVELAPGSPGTGS